MRHVAFGGVQHFGEHIVALGQRHLHAGKSLLYANFLFLEAINRVDTPDGNDQSYDQNNNYRNHNKFFLSLFLIPPRKNRRK